MFTKIFTKYLTITFLLLTIMMYSCSKISKKTVSGGGASFPYPLLIKIFKDFKEERNIEVNYQSIGSGGGVRQIFDKTGDFGVTDSFILNTKLKTLKDNEEILHVPITIGAVVVSYNLGNIKDLKIDNDTLVEIFTGKITKWNHLSIQKTNPDVPLPNKKIIVISRSDGSGTTAIFSTFLATKSTKWKETMGVGKSLEWFEGSIGAKGNEGVTAQLKKTEGAIAYIGLNYAKIEELPMVLIQNYGNRWVKATMESVKNNVKDQPIPTDTRVNLSDYGRNLGNTYPISSFSWAIFYKEQKYNNRTKKEAKLLKEKLLYIINEGQRNSEALHYVPLPENIVRKGNKIINSMTYDSKPIDL